MKKKTQSSTNSTKPVPSSLESFGYAAVVLILVLLLSTCIGCVALPIAPTTPLCVFVNTYTGEKLNLKSLKLEPDPLVKANPKLLGQIVNPVSGEHYYWRCRNHKSTKFNIPVISPSATNFVGTPYNDYVEMNAYLNKMAEVFKKEYLNKVGGK